MYMYMTLYGNGGLLNGDSKTNGNVLCIEKEI